MVLVCATIIATSRPKLLISQTNIRLLFIQLSLSCCLLFSAAEVDDFAVTGSRGGSGSPGETVEAQEIAEICYHGAEQAAEISRLNALIAKQQNDHVKEVRL